MYLSKCQALGLITVLKKKVLKLYVNYFKQKLGPERDFASNSKSTGDKRSILTYLQVKTSFYINVNKFDRMIKMKICKENDRKND